MEVTKLSSMHSVFKIIISIQIVLTSCDQEPKLVGDRPNIIVIMVDDMGFSDISSYGGEISTPNLNQLAENGLRFTQFYNAGRCCPSRASLQTGLYAHKTGLGYMTAQDYGLPGYRADLSLDCITIAEALKMAGYGTYAAGKWHVNRDFGQDGPKHNWPLQRGYDKFFGTLIAAGSYWNPLTLVEGNDYIEPEADFYYTEAITEKAVEYINQHEDTAPFFLYVAYTATHWPLHAREQAIAKYKGRFSKGWDQLRLERYERMINMGVIDSSWQLSPRDEHAVPWEHVKNQAWQQTRMEAYAGTIDHVDTGVGELVQALKSKGAFDNTIIFFLSDNGGDYTEHLNGEIGNTGKPWGIMRYVPLRTKDGDPVIAGDFPGIALGPENTYGSYGLIWANLSNTPFKKFKTYAHEGGIATPLIVHWPKGIVDKNQWRKQPAHIIDIMATSLDLANLEYPSTFKGHSLEPLDGKSLLGVLQQDHPMEREALFWEHQGNKAVRADDWKLVYSYGEDDWELYDLHSDRTETQNLAEQFPEKVEHLKELYELWANESNVLPWKELSINIIPPESNPLVRSEEEMKEVKAILVELNRVVETISAQGQPRDDYME